ncbi:MAG: PASTA domain-containing protein [Rhodothermales bacterium]
MANSKNVLTDVLPFLRSLVGNTYFWGGVAALGAVLFAGYVLVNHVIMPTVTRQGVSVRVPDLINQPFEQANTELESLDLNVERVVQRYNANFPRDVIVDQNPPPKATVKPGRRIYVTVNSGELQRVAVPDVGGLSIREAVNRLLARGLQVNETLPDSIPAPNRNTVTRQAPAPGDSLTEGSGVSLWYSTGLGASYATIPDVTGMTFEAARDTLLSTQLRSIVVGVEDEADLSELTVQRQSQEPGTRVRAGFEVRLYADEAAPTPPEE